MAITPLPPVPLRSDSPATFVTKADAFLGALNLFATEVDAVGVALTLGATNATSTTSLLIGLGSKSLTVQTGKSYVVGMTVKIASTALGSTWMLGDITSYTSGTGALVVTVTSISGSGTLAAWTISQSAPGGAQVGANADITSLSGLTTPLSVAQGGTGVTTSSGSGANILGTSPTLTTPTLTSPTLTSPIISGTPTGVGVLTTGTSTALSGTKEKTFIAIPSWVKRITLTFDSVSTTTAAANANYAPVVRIGDSSGIQSTGYTSYTGRINGAGAGSDKGSGTGYELINSGAGSQIYTGQVVLSQSATNTWVINGIFSYIDSSGGSSMLTGFKTLSSTLTQIQLTTVSGADNFDAGTINIMYE